MKFYKKNVIFIRNQIRLYVTTSDWFKRRSKDCILTHLELENRINSIQENE